MLLCAIFLPLRGSPVGLLGSFCPSRARGRDEPSCFGGMSTQSTFCFRGIGVFHGLLVLRHFRCSTILTTRQQEKQYRRGAPTNDSRRPTSTTGACPRNLRRGQEDAYSFFASGTTAGFWPRLFGPFTLQASASVGVAVGVALLSPSFRGARAVGAVSSV